MSGLDDQATLYLCNLDVNECLQLLFSSIASLFEVDSCGCAVFGLNALNFAATHKVTQDDLLSSGPLET